MAETSSLAHAIRFATFEVDLRAGEIRKSGMKLKLGGQSFQVLAILLERPGETVTREELQKRLWPDTFVDIDHNLNAAINKIREVLGDSAENPRFVETLPRRGYRFIAEVSANNRAPAAAAQGTQDRPHEVSAQQRQNRMGWVGYMASAGRSTGRCAGAELAEGPEPHFRGVAAGTDSIDRRATAG